MHVRWLQQAWVDLAGMGPRHDVRNVYIGIYAGIATAVLTTNALAWKQREPGFLTEKLRLPPRRQKKPTTPLQYAVSWIVVSITGLHGFLIACFLIALVPAIAAGGLHGSSFWGLQAADVIG